MEFRVRTLDKLYSVRTSEVHHGIWEHYAITWSEADGLTVYESTRVSITLQIDRNVTDPVYSNSQVSKLLLKTPFNLGALFPVTL